MARVNGIVSNNVITNNSLQGPDDAYGGGIFINATPKITLKNNIISYNRAVGSGEHVAGGGILYASQYEDGQSGFYNNIIIKNEVVGGRGGGLAFAYGSNKMAKVINNTIVDNKAGRYGGGISVDATFKVTMLNSIIWGNLGGINNQVHSRAGVNFILLYSDVQDGYSGIGNIASDPLFNDTLRYELSEDSPCISAAVDSIEIVSLMYYCPPYSFEDKPRPVPEGTVPDMGAIESPYGWPSSISQNTIRPLTFRLSQNYPNPFNPITIINYELPISSEVKLSIYNLLGQKVVTLVSEKQNAGHYQVQWDASSFASGVYFYRIESGEFMDVKKMILLR